MRSICSAGAAIALAGVATLAGAAVPAFAAGPQISVSPTVVTAGMPVSVSAVCISGKNVGTTATFDATALGIPQALTMSPGTGKGVFTTEFRVPAGTAPATYSPSVVCDIDGHMVNRTVAITVRSATSMPIVTKPVVIPSGAPFTGDGVTSTAVGGPLTAAGLGVLGLSALLGASTVRRRKAGKSRGR